MRRHRHATLPLLLLFCVAAEKGCDHRPPPSPAASTGTQQDAYRQPDRLIAALALHPGQHVAEVGAGGGYLTLPLARAVGPTGRVLGTDIDAEALSALRRRARAEGLSQVETQRVTPRRPDLAAGAYDLIVLAQVDHLLPDRTAYLRALLPALRAGGRIAVSNTLRHRDALLRAVQALPIVPSELHIGLPGQFLIVLLPR